MDVDRVSQKRLIELEQQVAQLLKTLRSTKLHQHPVYLHLQELEDSLAKARRSRFDETDSTYGSY